jgi:hypothetical protein
MTNQKLPESIDAGQSALQGLGDKREARKPIALGDPIAWRQRVAATFDVVEIRRRLSNPQRVVALLGLTRGMRKERAGVRVLCPVHKEREPSCSVSTGSDKTIRVHCWSCGWTGDVLHFVAVANGLDCRTDFRKVLAIAAELAGVSPDESPKGTARSPRTVRDPLVDLAHRIDVSAADWLAGRVVRRDATIEAASVPQLVDALALLEVADEAEHSGDAVGRAA